MPGIRHLTLGIIHHRITLVIRLVDNFLLETDGAVVELAKLIAVELIYFACEDYLVCDALPIRSILEEIYISMGLDAIQQTIYQLVVATHRDALVLIIEVVIIEDETNW